jgi:hypothetical protein
MNKYFFRKNFTALFNDQKQIVRGKLAFKTKETHWLRTEHPVVVSISIHSGFHKMIDGDLKMSALMSIIKDCTEGDITVLLCDKAHLNTLSLKYQNNPDMALQECLDHASILRQRYQDCFESCNVAFWHSYICHDNNYEHAQRIVKEIYQKDLNFREYVHQDAEASYTPERKIEFDIKEHFINMASEDILEQCACLLVLNAKGYRFVFYPGGAGDSMNYFIKTMILNEKQISWISIFLSIEKKTFS